MRALILAAGEGTRLRPLTLDRPKPMVPIDGRPLLEYLVRLLVAHGIEEIAINLHHRPQAIVDHFGDGSRFGARILYSPEEQLLGSAGAARRIDWYLSDPFVVLYGDVLTDADITSLIDAHERFGGLGTLLLNAVDDPTRCGIVQVNRSGRVTRFVEKPPTAEFGALANSGVYVLRWEVLERVPAGVPFDFGRDLFPALLAEGLPLYGVTTEGYVLDIGSPDRYDQAQRDVRASRVRSYAPALTGAEAPAC